MTEAQAIEAISALVVAQWPAVTSGLPLALENEALPAADSFGQLTIVPSTSQQITHGAPGNRRVERKGNIFVKFWTPADGGASPASALAGAVRLFLEMVSIPVVGQVEPVTTLAGNVQKAGNDGRWFLSALVVPFRFYETK